jgi:hypothetical protein
MIRLARGKPSAVVYFIARWLRCYRETLLTLTSLCPDVKDITVDSLIGTVPESTLVTLLRSWPRLTSISIDYNVSFTDTVLRAVVDLCPNLRHLDRE